MSFKFGILNKIKFVIYFVLSGWKVSLLVFLRKNGEGGGVRSSPISPWNHTCRVLVYFADFPFEW